MDPYNQWPDEEHELHEKTPINYNQQNYMTNDGREASVESVNIDNNYDGRKPEYNNAGEVYASETVKEESYILIWKYIEQIKSILAGSLLFVVIRTPQI